MDLNKIKNEHVAKLLYFAIWCAICGNKYFLEQVILSSMKPAKPLNVDVDLEKES